MRLSVMLLVSAIISVGGPASARCRCAQTVPTRTVSTHAVSGAADRAAVEDVTLPSGTDIPVRIDQSLSTKRDAPGTPFIGHIAAPVMRNGEMIVPRGAVARGHLIESKPSGRLKGRPVLRLALDSIEMRGRRYRIVTNGRTFVGKSHKGRNLAAIGGGAAGGAVIGAIAGDGVGAAIGAGAGAAAGTVGAFVTGRKNLRLPPETRVDFALVEPVRLRG